MSLSDSVEVILRHVRRDLDSEVAVDRILGTVLVDSRNNGDISAQERARVSELGVDVVEVPLTRDDDPTRHDPQRVSEALLSLA